MGEQGRQGEQLLKMKKVGLYFRPFVKELIEYVMEKSCAEQRRSWDMKDVLF